MANRCNDAGRAIHQAADANVKWSAPLRVNELAEAGIRVAITGHTEHCRRMRAVCKHRDWIPAE